MADPATWLTATVPATWPATAVPATWSATAVTWFTTVFTPATWSAAAVRKAVETSGECK